MASEAARLRAVILIFAVFMSLVIVQLWLGVEEEGDTADEERPRTPRVQITKEGEQVDLSPRASLTPGELQELTEGRINLLQGGERNERRATAIRLAYMANDPQEQGRFLQLSDSLIARVREALLGGLNDPDDVVSMNCRDALIGLWRIPASPTAALHLRQGLAAYEARQWEGALQSFDTMEEARGALPPDLYRMKAEIWLTKSLPERAVDECKSALKAEPNHFLAYYLLAKAYAQKDDYEQALKALDAALTVYKRFPEAKQMREEVLGRETGDPS